MEHDGEQLRWNMVKEKYGEEIDDGAKKYMDVSENNGTPQIIHFTKVFHHKPSILGYPYFLETPIWWHEIVVT